MPRAKKLVLHTKMPRELWVAPDPGWMEYLTWDVDPAMPKGETATRYVRADVADAMLAVVRRLDYYREAFLAKQYDVGSPAVSELLDEARAAIAKAEGTNG